MKNIVVFAGNGCYEKYKEDFFPTAYNVGKLLAKSGYKTITGGGPGLMNEVLKGAYENGGDTLGICLETEGRKQSEYAKERLTFSDLRIRQKKLIDSADSFIAVPGGIGTYYEIFEVLTLKRKGQLGLNKKLILVSSYFKNLVEFIQKSVNLGFTQGYVQNLYFHTENIQEVIKILSLD